MYSNINKNMIFFTIPTKFVKRQPKDVSPARQIDPDPAPEDNALAAPIPLIPPLIPLLIREFLRAIYIMVTNLFISITFHTIRFRTTNETPTRFIVQT